MPPSRSRARLLLAALASARALAAQTPSLDTPAFAARVDSLFDAWRGTDRPGCAVGVSERGRVVLERGYGMADVESGAPMTPTTVVHAASLAKQFTAMAALLLARDGKLSLDDDVRRYLPELPVYAAPVTVRQLLTHTSGLRDFFELLIIARGRFEEERVTDADATAVIARQHALNFAPGAEYAYSNTGYLLAAHVVSRVSGRPFAEFVAERVFRPLGMTRTRVRDDATTLILGRALGYARRGAGWRLSAPNFDVVGSTNVETTVGDLLRWSANLDRPVVGDSAIVRQMLTPAVLATGDTTTYGLGLSLGRDRGFHVAEHEGSDPGFRAYLGRYLEPGLTVALLCNTSALNSVALGHDVAGLALGAGTAPPTLQPTPPRVVDPHRTLAWAGVYLEPSTRQVAELTVRDGVLYTDRTGGARVEAIDTRRARLVGVPLELTFDSAGAHPGYQVRWLVPGRRADRFVWQAPTAPALSANALAAYAGTYRSAELGVDYRVEVRDSALTLRTLHNDAAQPLVARAVFPDGFVSGQYTIQFARRRGRVTGFAISHPRARGVTFVRAAPSLVPSLVPDRVDR